MKAYRDEFDKLFEGLNIDGAKQEGIWGWHRKQMREQSFEKQTELDQALKQRQLKFKQTVFV